MSADFQVSIGGKRGEEWKQIAGTDTFPVKTPIPRMGKLPGYSEPQEIYLLDLNEVEAATLEKIVAHLSRKFSMSPQETEQEIRAAGIPILAKDCAVIIHNPQKWF